MERRMKEWVDHPSFHYIILVLILLNCLVLGLETYDSLFQQYSAWFFWVDRVILWIFTLEVAIRILAERPFTRFFKEGWNVFDLVIITSGYLFAGLQFITVLRVIRILKILRILSVVSFLRRIVHLLSMTLPAIFHTLILFGMFFYIYAILGSFLFGKLAPDYFGSIHLSLFTLFQIMTFESWATDIARPIMATLRWAWLYFMSFLLIGIFIVIHLVVSIILFNLHKMNPAGAAFVQAPVDFTPTEVQQLRMEISELRALIQSLKQEKKEDPFISPDKKNSNRSNSG